ncbi:MAG TPA: prepilin-type N-terminal cleavage/methylation domain-containing protein [Desulfuromonadales bacterium]|nr:prepilin-type N-terminal cleavage/methylation domain-containing protein [Desulfuromonadales bacterium]
MNSRGFTLIELIIVIVLIGIVIAAVSLDFNSWMKKASVDAQTKELNSDFSDLRMRAIQTKRNHMAIVETNKITFCSYSSEEPVNPANCTANPPNPALHGAYFTKFLKYQITFSGDVGVNSRGMLNDFFPAMSGGTFNSNQTIVVLPSGTGASVDCLVLSDTRSNMGTFDGTKCVYK